MTGAYERGRGRFPGVKSMTPEAYARFVEGRVSERSLLEHGEDLFLACACARGDEAAIAEFDAGPLQQVRASIERLARCTGTLDEVIQRTRIKLLVGSPPLVATYAGAGPLAAWARVCAVRIALDLREQTNAQAEPSVLDRLGVEEALPEARLAGERFRAQLEAALARAVDALAPEQRVLLRMHFLDDLSIDDLAKVLRVHRATAARRLVAIRNRVLIETKQQMSAEFGTSSSEFRSLWRVFGDEIRVSISRLLRPDERRK